MDYRIYQLTPRIYFIRWLRQPNITSAMQWVKDLRGFLNQADASVYFVSDVRQGVVEDVRVLSHLAELIKHRNWGGGLSLSDSLSGDVYVQMYGRLSGAGNQRDICRSPEEISERLNLAEAGIDSGIEWDSVFNSLHPPYPVVAGTE
jgi:hypothetical protein